MSSSLHLTPQSVRLLQLSSRRPSAAALLKPQDKAKLQALQAIQRRESMVPLSLDQPQPDNASEPVTPPVAEAPASISSILFDAQSASSIAASPILSQIFQEAANQLQQQNTQQTMKTDNPTQHQSPAPDASSVPCTPAVPYYGRPHTLSHLHDDPSSSSAYLSRLHLTHSPNPTFIAQRNVLDSSTLDEPKARRPHIVHQRNEHHLQLKDFTAVELAESRSAELQRSQKARESHLQNLTTFDLADPSATSNTYFTPAPALSMSTPAVHRDRRLAGPPEYDSARAGLHSRDLERRSDRSWFGSRKKPIVPPGSDASKARSHSTAGLTTADLDGRVQAKSTNTALYASTALRLTIQPEAPVSEPDQGALASLISPPLSTRRSADTILKSSGGVRAVLNPRSPPSADAQAVEAREQRRAELRSARLEREYQERINAAKVRGFEIPPALANLNIAQVAAASKPVAQLPAAGKPSFKSDPSDDGPRSLPSDSSPLLGSATPPVASQRVAQNRASLDNPLAINSPADAQFVRSAPSTPPVDLQPAYRGFLSNLSDRPLTGHARKSQSSTPTRSLSISSVINPITGELNPHATAAARAAAEAAVRTSGPLSLNTPAVGSASPALLANTAVVDIAPAYQGVFNLSDRPTSGKPRRSVTSLDHDPSRRQSFSLSQMESLAANAPAPPVSGRARGQYYRLNNSEGVAAALAVSY